MGISSHAQNFMAGPYHQRRSPDPYERKKNPDCKHIVKNIKMDRTHYATRKPCRSHCGGYHRRGKSSRKTQKGVHPTIEGGPRIHNVRRTEEGMSGPQILETSLQYVAANQPPSGCNLKKKTTKPPPWCSGLVVGLARRRSGDRTPVHARIFLVCRLV